MIEKHYKHKKKGLYAGSLDRKKETDALYIDLTL